MKAKWFKDECDFRNIIDRSEFEACCLYEYFRESAAMREAVKEKSEMPLAGDAWDTIRIRIALKAAGFPVAWNKLTEDHHTKLIEVFPGWRKSDTNILKHPPLVVSELPRECFEYYDQPDELDAAVKQFQLEAGVKRFLEKAHVPASFSEAEAYPVDDSHNYFFGCFRLDEAYNETDASEAFKAWFKERRDKGKGGNRDRWKSRLTNLVVLRISKHIKDKKERAWMVGEFTPLKGCKTYFESHRANSAAGMEEGASIDPGARVEMTKARKAAREYFYSLFPGQEPVSDFHEGES